MYEKLTKYIPKMGPNALSFVYEEKFMEALFSLVHDYHPPFGSGCLEPEEISLAATDREFLETLQGETIVSAMRDIFGADRIVEGTVDRFVKSGAFQVFLVRLKELDEGREVVVPKKNYSFHERVAAKRKEKEQAVEREWAERLGRGREWAEREERERTERIERVKREWAEREERERTERIERVERERAERAERERAERERGEHERGDPEIEDAYERMGSEEPSAAFEFVISAIILLIIFFLNKSCSR